MLEQGRRVVKVDIGQGRGIFFDRINHTQSIKRFAKINLHALVIDACFTEHLGCDVTKHVFSELHEVLVIPPGDVELHHREFRIVTHRNSLIPEVAVDLEHALEAADDQTLQIKLRRDPQIKLHVQRVVMGLEWPRGSTAGDRMHHRRFDFEVTMADHEFAHRLDNFRAHDKGIAHLRIHDQIDIAHAIALFGIGEAVEFFRQRADRLGDQANRFYVHG